MPRRIHIRSLWLALAVLLPAASACRDESLVGTYHATTFTYAAPGSAPVDVLAAGGSVTLQIFANLGTTGTLVMPGSVVQGDPVSVSLLGDASQQGDVVTISTVADTFLRNMELTFDGSTLSGTHTFSGVTVVLVLSK